MQHELQTLGYSLKSTHIAWLIYFSPFSLRQEEKKNEMAQLFLRGKENKAEWNKG